MHGIFVTEMQNLALGLLKACTIGPAQTSLHSLPILTQIDTTSKLDVLRNLLKVYTEIHTGITES